MGIATRQMTAYEKANQADEIQRQLEDEKRKKKKVREK